MKLYSLHNFSSHPGCCLEFLLTHNTPNRTIAEFTNTVDPDEMAHNEPSHLDLQCLPSSL